MPEITFPAPAGPLPGYLAVPSGTEPAPGVVIVHDGMGMSTDTKNIVERFAAEGYLTLAPALFRRGNRVKCVVQTMRSVSTGTGPAVDDVIAARDHLAADPRSTGKVGVVGFCMGGGFALLLAPRGVFDAAAANYGVWPEDTAALTKSCPMVASYGAKDRMLPGAADKLRTLLTEGSVPHDVKEYPDVGHSFMNDWKTPGPVGALVRLAGLQYSPAEADDAFGRIFTFFDKHLR